MSVPEVVLKALNEAIHHDQGEMIAELLDEHPIELDCCPPGGPPLVQARSVATAELLLSRGATAGFVSEWWKPGFGVQQIPRDVGRVLIERGAVATPHVLAALGMVDELHATIEANPAVALEPGGDGGHPLHFARDVATAELLLEHGADIDARDTDHDSTPAQWNVGRDPRLARFLLDRGATPDIFMASALGDGALCDSLIDEDPARLGTWIGRDPFPGIGHEGRGGTILQWSLAFNSFAHQIALAKGHDALGEHLFERSDIRTQLLVACVLKRRDVAERIAQAHPAVVASLDSLDLELPARYCWETNIDIEVVRLMLDVGFPVDHPETSHGFAPLHNAAWCGDGDLVDLLIERGAAVDRRDPNWHATALQFAVHCCVKEKRHPEGDYERVAESLVAAACPVDASAFPCGDDRIDRVLERHLR